MSDMDAERDLARAKEPPAAADGVRLSGARKTFGAVVALHDASLAVRTGELLTLLGPSGCGKTTLLNLVAGFLAPDAGDIAIDGHRVNEVPTYKRQIGMMFQSYALFPHLSAADNIGYGLKVRGVVKAEARRRVAEALALVKLAGVEARRPHQLSGGQQQRVALARALVVRPKVLLLDEPFSALDRNLRAAMQVEVKEIQRQLGLTTIFVTHDQGEALSISDRIAVMFDGRIRQVGTPEQIYSRPCDRQVAAFVGDVNVFAGRLDRLDVDSAHVSLGAARLEVPRQPLAALRPGDAVDVFVRPEQLHLAAPGEAVAAAGVVAAHLFHGAHVDVQLGVAAAVGGRVLVRLAAPQARDRWPVGARIDLAVAREAVAFLPVPAP
jgi:ABC-type Fe3+/spermidine/putrescine transport system ATPase subunit